MAEKLGSTGGSTTVAARAGPKVIFSALTLSALSYAFLQSMALPALPAIERDLHASTTATAWLLTGFLLSTAVVTPIAGRLGDILGKKRVLVAVLVVLTAGTLISASAQSIGVLIAGRVVQGASGAVFPLAFGIIRDELPSERSADGIALISSILGVGTGIGIVLAGPIIEALGYHWLFWLPLGPVLLATAATVAFIPESQSTVPDKVDWSGAALLSLWLLLVLVGIGQAAPWGWGDPRVLALLLSGSALAVVWVAFELRSAQPLVDMAVMRIRGVWTVNLAAALVGCGMYSSFVMIPQFVQVPASTGYGFGGSVTVAGLFMLPATLCMLLGGPLASVLERRIGSRLVLTLGCLLVAASFTVFAIANSERAWIYASTGILGFGIGLSFAALAQRIVEAVPASQTGIATGMNTVMRTTGGAAGSQASATIIAASSTAGGYAALHGFVLAAIISAAAALIAAFAALASSRRLRGGERRALATAAIEP